MYTLRKLGWITFSHKGLCGDGKHLSKLTAGSLLDEVDSNNICFRARFSKCSAGLRGTLRAVSLRIEALRQRGRFPNEAKPCVTVCCRERGAQHLRDRREAPRVRS